MLLHATLFKVNIAHSMLQSKLTLLLKLVIKLRTTEYD